MTDKNIAFIGLGRMGANMVRHLSGNGIATGKGELDKSAIAELTFKGRQDPS